MMQVIDKDYLAAMLALPDGMDRLLSWIESLIEQRETAEQIAKACVAQMKGAANAPP